MIRWPRHFLLSVVAFDPAEEVDPAASVFCGWSGSRYFVDAVIRHCPIEQGIRDSLRLANIYNADMIVAEANVYRSLLAPEFHRQSQHLKMPPRGVWVIKNHEKKLIRIDRLGPYLEQRLFLFRPTEGSRLLVNQLKEYPLAKHDDGPDALEMGLRHLHTTAQRDMLGM